LCLLKLSGNHHGRTFAKDLLVTLLNLSSGLSVLDLSDNKVSISSAFAFYILSLLLLADKKFRAHASR